MNNIHPITLFEQWYSEVQHSGVKEPTAVCLSTATKCGAPSARMVLLKHYDEEGFVIYTNMLSRKGKELRENPQAALCFCWQHLDKQVCIEGYVEEVSNEEADAYFNSRSPNSKIGAWASKQSEPMKHKNDLVKRVAKYTALWALNQVSRPPHWTGIRIIPDCFEFVYSPLEHREERKLFKLQDGEWQDYSI